VTRVQARGRTAGREERRGRIRAVLMTIIPELSGTDLAAALQSIESQRVPVSATSTTTWPSTPAH
jgi:hypothetical protein